MAVTLTPQQYEAIAWLVARLGAGAPLVALKGNAGTGKTTLIAPLQQALRAGGLPSRVGTPTHRAAALLRRHGVREATTVHEHALMPYFKPDYQRALDWLGGQQPAWCAPPPDPLAAAHDDVEGLPWLVYEQTKPVLEDAWNLKRLGTGKNLRKLLATIGIDGREYFAGSTPKVGEGVLIVDEASMVGATLLAECQRAFTQICLIGDPDQLPPVQDRAVFQDIEGFTLTEPHRQATDSGIIRLAYRVRDGEAVWKEALPESDDVHSTAHVEADVLRHSPLIVFRNTVRETCTHKIRAALGYARHTLYPGEPLLCRSTHEDLRAMGFYNNGLYRLVAVSPDNPREVTVEDENGDQQTVLIHLEELDGKRPGYHAIPFRFAYCFTAHTAQGGEWPTVYVSQLELRYKESQILRHGRDRTELQQWAYTAITRAKTQLYFLTQYSFLSTERTVMPTTPVKPPSAPMMTSLPGEEPPLLSDAVPALDHAEDIPDPVVPAATLAAVTPAPLPLTFGEHEAIIQGAVQHLSRKLEAQFDGYAKHLMKELDDVCGYITEQLRLQKEKTQQAETLLNTLTTKAVQDGIQLRHDPYVASVQVVTPSGFPMTFTVAQRSREALLAEMPQLIGWLKEHQFTAPEHAPY